MEARTLAARPTRARAARSALSAAVLAGLTAGSLAGCVSPPALEDVASFGYRSPEQAFRAFQLAVRADSPAVEYRCLSDSFRARHQLSQLAWREFRAEWYRANPFLRRGIAKARIVSQEPLGPLRHLIVAEAYGKLFEVELAREDYYQVYSGATLASDGLLAAPGLAAHLEVRRDLGADALVLGAVELPESELPGEITELRIGAEWKIDGIRELSASHEPSHTSRADP